MLQHFRRCTHDTIQKTKSFLFHRNQINSISSCWNISKNDKSQNNIHADSFHINFKTSQASLFQEYKKLFTTSQCQKLKEDHKTTSLTVWSDLKQLKSSPLPVLTLGLGGLIPFMAAPAYMITKGVFLSDLAFAQVAYGACILSFIGGVRWGFTLYEDNPVQPDWINLGYSVTPSLIAWAGLLLPSPLSYVTLIGGLTFAAYADMAMFGYPSWFKGLRFLLTIVAILSLWTSFMYGLFQKTPPKDEQKNAVNESSK